MTKISSLSDIGTGVASNDTFVLVDASDPTTPNKKIQQQNLFLIPDGSQGTPALRFLNDTDVGLYRPTTNALGLVTGGSERLRIDSSGRVGIGTSAPSQLLTLQQTSAGSAVDCLFLNNSSISNGTAVGISFGPNTANDIARSAIIRGINESGGAGNATGLGFFTNANGSAPTQKVTITSGGSVGIGTTSPNRLLTANGIVGIQASGTEYLRVYGQSSAGIIDSVSSKDLILDANGASNSLLFYQGGAEAARIDSSKRLLVGTSSSVTTYKTEIVDDASLNLALVTGSSSSAANCPFLTIRRSRGSTASPSVVSPGDKTGTIDFRGYSGAASSYVSCAQISAAVDGTPDSGGDTTDMPGRLVFSTTADGASSPTERMRIANDGLLATYGNTNCVIAASAAVAGTTHATFRGRRSATSTQTGVDTFIVYTNGDVVNTNNSYGAISDIKLKENIVNANSQWSDIKALQVRNYNFKEGQTHTQIGLVAQEVELVSPGLVSESPDRDEDGNDLGTVTKSVNYSVLYMKAVKALQEAMERIEQLEAEMAAVKSQLS